MTISRRDLLRTGLVVGAGLAAPLGGALSPAVAAGDAAGNTTLATTFRRGAPGRGDYAPVVRAPGEPHVVRTDLGAPARPHRAGRRQAVLAFVQLSDVHIVDVQSPARVEWLDRFDDQYSSSHPTAGIVASAYRPHEMLTAQVAESMVRAVRQVAAGPVTGQPLAFAIQTGDNSDNSQYNETRWNIDLLDGGRSIRPDSGDLGRFEGVSDTHPLHYDGHYWHPDGAPLGRPRDIASAAFGFPTVPGLLTAARRPFTASGLGIPWFTAFGNHDGLVQGNFPASTLQLDALATGPLKLVSPPAGASQGDLLHAFSSDPLSLVRSLSLTPHVRVVTPDAERRLLTRAEVVAEHFRTTGTPVGHGFTEANRADGTAYYAFTRGRLRFVVLDTVNPNGYADGSLDAQQFAWLHDELAASTDKAVVVASHHTSDTMANALVVTGGDLQPRVLGEEVLALLLGHRHVIAWVNGHTHRNRVTAHRRADGSGGLWEINTASHVEWPQQSRVVEVLDNADGTWSIFTTMLDHAGPASYDGDTGGPVPLAGLARELAANDWQERTTGREGGTAGRNAELLLPDPFSAPAR